MFCSRFLYIKLAPESNAVELKMLFIVDVIYIGRYREGLCFSQPLETKRFLLVVDQVHFAMLSNRF